MKRKFKVYVDPADIEYLLKHHGSATIYREQRLGLEEHRKLRYSTLTIDTPRPKKKRALTGSAKRSVKEWKLKQRKKRERDVRKLRASHAAIELASSLALLSRSPIARAALTT